MIKHGCISPSLSPHVLSPHIPLGNIYLFMDFGMVKLSWRRDVKPLEPKLMVNPRLLELKTAKEILEEVFHARPSDVDDMIQRRLDENNLSRDISSEETQWPQEFCLGD
jgi:hypothetical protein